MEGRQTEAAAHVACWTAAGQLMTTRILPGCRQSGPARDDVI